LNTQKLGNDDPAASANSKGKSILSSQVEFAAAQEKMLLGLAQKYLHF
jgi:hypothetical protein